MSRLDIAFLGQCHTTGYAGVEPDRAFPEVCRRLLEAARPGHQVELILQPYYHPAELPAVAAAALQRQPRVVVIEVVGWLAMTGSGKLDLSRLPRGVRSAYDRARFFRKASRTIGRQTRGSNAIHRVSAGALGFAGSILRPLLPKLPRPSIGEYEACLSDTLATIRATGIHAVVQGPGAGNFAMMSKRLPPDAVERYTAVRAMAQRVAAAHGALYVDRWDTVSGGFFIPGTTRPTLQGHSAWGHLLADHLLRAGLV